jgi:hypothetical protein
LPGEILISQTFSNLLFFSILKGYHDPIELSNGFTRRKSGGGKNSGRNRDPQPKESEKAVFAGIG